MRLGITGHQSREGIDWVWVRGEIGKAIASIPGGVVGLSSLAAGSDQVFAECVLDSGSRLIAVIPEAAYEDAFEDASDLNTYRALLARSEIVELTPEKTEERSFLKAGRWIVDHADGIIAVWDGEPAEGIGGTADIVAYATETGKSVLHINPIAATVARIGMDSRCD